MSKDLKAILAKKLAANSQRHASAQHDMDFDVGRQHTQLPVEIIDPNPYQPRQVFHPEDLESLASSIAESGLLQPISVRQIGQRYQLIAGERRWRAHKLLGRNTIEALVISASDSDMAVLALTENLDREDLSDYEVGKALRQIEDLFPTKKRLAESLGLNREDMYRYYAFEALPDVIKTRLDAKPHLLSRSAASDLKRFLNNADDVESISDLLLDAWTLIERGTLEQSKLVAHLQKAIAARHRVAPEDSSLDFQINGRVVGSIKRNTKNVVVRLATAAISTEQERELRLFLDRLLSNAQEIHASHQP